GRPPCRIDGKELSLHEAGYRKSALGQPRNDRSRSLRQPAGFRRSRHLIAYPPRSFEEVFRGTAGNEWPCAMSDRHRSLFSKCMITTPLTRFAAASAAALSFCAPLAALAQV